MNSLYERWFHVAKSLNGSADHKTHECQVCHLLVRVADHVLATYAKDEGECSETRHAFAIDHLFVRDSTLFHVWTSAKHVAMKRPDILRYAASFTVGDGDREQAERLESCICGIMEGLWSHASNDVVALEMTLAYSVTLLDMLARKGDRAKVLLARDFLMKHIHEQSRRRMNGRLINTMTVALVCCALPVVYLFL